MDTCAAATEAAVLFVDVPDDFGAPTSSWCLGYRSMVAALRREGIDAAILHPRSDGPRGARAALIEDLLEADAPVVGFTTYDVALPALLDLVTDLREAGLRSHVVLGGLCASAVPQRILRESSGVDAVVFGEGEATIVEHVQAVLGGRCGAPVPGVCSAAGGAVRSGPVRPAAADLDALAPPALDDFRIDGRSAPMRLVNGSLPVTASRGCYGRCTFCSIENFYRSCSDRPWRGRDPQRIADEVAATVAATGRRRITFVDENFMGPGAAGRRHAVAIGEEFRQRGLDVAFNFGCRPNDVDRDTLVQLRAAGLQALSIGAESAAEATLALFGKGTTLRDNLAAVALCRELDLPLEITFIFFQPLSTLDEVRANLDFVDVVRRSGTAYFNNGNPFTEFIPFFGTRMTAQLLEAGLVELGLRGRSVRYADARVAYVARCVTDVPSHRLVRLADALSALRRPVTDALSQHLFDEAADLTMRRLPALAADLCDAFEAGAAIGDARVERVAARCRAETARIAATTGRVLEHLH